MSHSRERLFQQASKQGLLLLLTIYSSAGFKQSILQMIAHGCFDMLCKQVEEAVVQAVKAGPTCKLNATISYRKGKWHENIMQAWN